MKSGAEEPSRHGSGPSAERYSGIRLRSLSMQPPKRDASFPGRSFLPRRPCAGTASPKSGNASQTPRSRDKGNRSRHPDISPQHRIISSPKRSQDSGDTTSFIPSKGGCHGRLGQAYGRTCGDRSRKPRQSAGRIRREDAGAHEQKPRRCHDVGTGPARLQGTRARPRYRLRRRSHDGKARTAHRGSGRRRACQRHRPLGSVLRSIEALQQGCHRGTTTRMPSRQDRWM